MCGCAARSPASRASRRSGHCYFTLKDERACIDAVIWQTTVQRLRFKPEEGLEMIATGRLTTFPGRSRYQIVIDASGAGRRRRADGAPRGAARRSSRRKGLFDAGAEAAAAVSAAGDRRRHLADRRGDPRHPAPAARPLSDACPRLAGAGAGRRRRRRRLRRRSPASTRSRPAAIVPRPDLLIVARGGGVVEDLWAFNEEVVGPRRGGERNPDRSRRSATRPTGR